MLYDVCGATNIGRRREENQDEYRIDRDIGLYIVADGMGGMDHGKEAAKYAVDRLALGIRLALDDMTDKTYQNITKMFEEQLDLADKGVRKHFGWNSGTTVVILLIVDDSAYVTHVGDSRAYMYRRNVLHQLTEDHDQASKFVRSGELTKEEARGHPSQCLVTNYLGGMIESDDILVITRFDINTKNHIRFLLCTDGLTNMVSDRRIAEILGGAESPDFTVAKLIERANKEGGTDNITALIVDIKPKE